MSYRKVRIIVTLAQCLGLLPYVLINDSPVIILYTSLLGCSQFISIATTSTLPLFRMFLTPIFAVIVDRAGKKKIIIPASVVSGLAFSSLALAPLAGSLASPALMVLLALFATAIAIFTAGWFPLLKDNVPAGVRGNFFGTLRASWSLASMVFLVLIGVWAGKKATLGQLQIVIVVSGLFALARAGLVSLLPETDTRTPGLKIREILSGLLSHRDLIYFCIYLFIMYGLVGGTLPVAYIMARNALTLPDNFVINLTSVVMVANILGFITGGFVNDRFGTKPIFLTTHAGFGAICLLLLTVNTGAPAWYIRIALPALVGAFGFLYSGASIAVTTQIFALSKGTIEATALSVGMAMYMGGSAFSRLGSGWILDTGLLAPAWTLGGTQLTSYHTIFLLSGLGVLAAVILLSLVPSVLTKRHDYPRR